MRIASFTVAGRATYGLLDGSTLREAAPGLRKECPDLSSLLAAGRLEDLQGRLGDETIDVDSVRFLPVVPVPGKILCVGVNYRPHVEEMGREIPAHPVVFVRFPDSLVGHGEPLVRPRLSEQYDFEGELAVVIGRTARYVEAAEAMDYVAGFVPFLDGSVRDWQRHTMQFTPGKNFPASGAVGPALVTPDEVGDVEALELTTRVSGEVMQHGRVRDLIFGIPALLEYCSAFTRLEPGDVIATGTPGGVGAARRPPRWLEAGDRVEVDLGPAGCLANTVVDEVHPAA